MNKAGCLCDEKGLADSSKEQSVSWLVISKRQQQLPGHVCGGPLLSNNIVITENNHCKKIKKFSLDIFETKEERFPWKSLEIETIICEKKSSADFIYK